MTINDKKIRYFKSIFAPDRAMTDMQRLWLIRQFGRRNVGNDDLAAFFAAQGFDSTTLNRQWIDYVEAQMALPVEYREIVSRMRVKPTAAQATRLQTMIANLKTAGIWAQADLIYVIASHDAQAAYQNLKGDIYNLVPLGTTTFTADRGISGNGTNGVLQTLAPGNALTKFTQNNATLAVYETSNVQADTYSLGTPSNNNIRVAGRLLSGAGAFRLNSAAVVGVTTTTSLGLTSGSRQDGTNVVRYRNGASGTTSANASAALTSSAFTFLRSGSIYSTRRIGFGLIGGYLSPTQHSDLYTITHTHMVAIGADT